MAVPAWFLVMVGVALVLAGCWTVGDVAFTAGLFVFGVLTLLWAAARAAPERGSGGRS